MKRLLNPKPVSKLIEADRNAPAVFLAILELAQGGDHVKCTRGDIRSVTGLSEKRITKAVTALHNARWVHRAYGRRGISAQWYQISVGKWVSPLRVRKRPSRKRTEGTKTTLKAQTLEGPKTTLLSLKRESDAQTPSPLAIASAPALRSPVVAEHPADRIEREHFERLRKKKPDRVTEEGSATHPDARVQRIVEAFDGRIVSEHQHVTGPYIPNPGEPPEQIDGVPDGWSREAWIGRLRQMADRCEPDHPARADELRKQAEALRT